MSRSLFAGIALALAGCTKEAAAVKPAVPSVELAGEFSGEKAFEHTRRQVELGPRPSGTSVLEKARVQIVETLQAAGWEVERQAFDDKPVPHEGAIHFTNLIARFPAGGAGKQRAIVCSHYDTKRMSGVRFVGASDGASSTGALLELARVLAKMPTLAEQVELVFFDGEEAVDHFDEPIAGPDGLVGSRHYARTLRESGRAGQFRFAILWDMIGDADLTITLPPNTPAELAGKLFSAAEALGTRKYLSYHVGDILDDHVPLQTIARIPAIDLIDFDYPHWHQPSDTLDKLSPESLRIVGQMTVRLLQHELAKP